MSKAPGSSDLTGPTLPGAGGADLTGRALGDFRILRLLGQGGMGTVYLAEQTSLKRKVALKLLRADLAANPTSLQRFRAEAEAVARVTHPNIVQIYQYGECEGLQYIALEYVEGRNLRDYLARKGPPELLLALSIMRQVASALQRASEQGIIHRDIKPDNILLTRKGEVKVTDFGLSRCLSADGHALHLTQSGVTMGTPLYMSPEQVQGTTVDARTDVYSFGVTCYAMLAGRPPFRGENPFEVALHHVNTAPEPLHAIRPDLPAALCGIVHKMMAKDPAQRYPGGRELIRDLARLRDGLAQARGAASVPSISLDSLPALPAPAILCKPTAAATAVLPRRRWLPAALVLSVFVAVALGAGGGWLLRRQAAAVAADVPAAEGEAAPGDTFVSLHKREEFLKEAVAEYANPGKDATQIQLGFGHYLELGLFYLDQGRLEEADELFTRLADQKQEVPRYRFLGQLGRAIVLGLQSKPAESNAIFLRLFTGRPGVGEYGALQFLKNNPRVHLWVARALDYNHTNETAQAPFPPKLEYLRHPNLPPGQVPRGAGKGERAGGKKT